MGFPRISLKRNSLSLHKSARTGAFYFCYNKAMKKSIFIVFAAVLLLSAGCGTGSKTEPGANQPIGSADAQSNAMAVYTLEQVAEHGSAASCWSVINNNVYDLTQWIALHPGGQTAILKLCGTDGTSLYQGQHGSFPPAAEALAKYQIGILE